MENVHSTFSPTSVHSKESQDNFNEEEIDEYASTKEVDDDDYVQSLLDREIISAAVIQLKSWIKEARIDAIQFILNKRALFGFKFRTAYLSVTYMDRFLSRRLIDGEKCWVVRLLAMACLLLAAKMEECVVPALSEFPIGEYNFESRGIQRMELLVLSTLEWKMKSVTPYAFIHYMVSKLCNDSPSKNIVSRVVEVILAAIRDVNLMSYRPSVIAAAAILITLDPRLNREALELKLNGLSSSWSPNIQHVWPCYNQLKDLDMERFKSSNCIVSPPLSPIELQKIKNAEISATTPAFGAKKKRLGFNESDQNCDMPNEKRHG